MSLLSTYVGGHFGTAVPLVISGLIKQSLLNFEVVSWFGSKASRLLSVSSILTGCLTHLALYKAKSSFGNKINNSFLLDLNLYYCADVCACVCVYDCVCVSENRRETEKIAFLAWILT